MKSPGIILLLAISLACTGCGEVGGSLPVPKPVVKAVVKHEIKKVVNPAQKKKKKPQPRPIGNPVIWSPVMPKIPAQCPDGKCPYGEVIYDGAKFWEVPGANLPLELRQKNWGGGSCVFASTVYDLRWHSLNDKATWLRNNYSGGADAQRIANALDKGQVRYAYTHSGDEAFLHWCTRTRRPATIFYYSRHSVTFCGIMDGYVYLLDNNRTGSFQVIPEQEFYSKWKGYGGFALAILDGSPAPPLPWKVI